MKFAKWLTIALLAVCVTAPANAAEKAKSKVPEALRFTMKSIDGKKVKLSKYQGKVLLIVNVASQ